MVALHILLSITNIIYFLNRAGYKSSRRNYTPPMQRKRNHAASVINERGDLWVLGGIDGSDSVDQTEVFDFKYNLWRNGRPLPAALRDSGLSSHCAVRYSFSDSILKSIAF